MRGIALAEDQGLACDDRDDLSLTIQRLDTRTRVEAAREVSAGRLD